MQAPYGSWSSPIDGRAVAEDSGWTYTLVKVVGDDLYWSESRPAEDGRDALVVRRGGAAPVDVIPAEFSARTRVHEYGGGAYTVDGGTVYYCNDADQRVYRVDPGAAPRPITPEPDVPFGLRYADLEIVGERVICVRERVAEPEHVNELVAFSTDGALEPRVIAEGHDFYAAPRISPSGAELAWLTWDHPRMPWEGSELWTAPYGDGSLGEARRVAGGPSEAIIQPEWSPDGVLHFSSDRTGWWNLYRGDYEPVTALEAEVGGPMWEFDESWYTFLPDGRILCTVFSDGSDRLAVIDAPGELRYLDLAFTRIVDLTTDGRRAVFAGASPTREAVVVAADLTTGATEILAGETEAAIDARYVSVPRPLEFPTTGGKTAHALFYPPHNPDYTAPAGELPPLLVRIHGGPTAHVTARLSRELQFFTSRGFAVVDVNYGGSTG
jgi:dipeptidyl aminopeptidase/acylaminoacyl peptidase